MKKYLITVLMTSSLLMLLMLGVLQPANAQVLNESALKQLAGYYQFRENKESYLQISVADKQLKLTQLWDSKILLFDQQQGLNFTASDNPGFTLMFTKDSLQNINTVVAFGKDVWDKRPDYQPLPEIILSAQEQAIVKQALQDKMQAYVAAVNVAQPNLLAKFVKDQLPEKLQETSPIPPIYKSTGGVTLYKEIVFQPGKRKAVYLLKGKVLNNFFELNLTLDAQNKIKEMEVYEVRVPEYPVQKFKDQATLIASLRATAEALSRTDIFSGTILLAKNDQILFTYACGDAIKAKGTKNNINTLFNIGSMNKMFTATAIMQLVDKGSVKLDDPISKYMDTTWLPQEIMDKVTIHHLLSHSSGMGDFFREAYDKLLYGKVNQLKDFKPYIKEKQLAFEPGTAWAYSNSGMIWLGLIIEKVTGQDYFEYVREHIYKPSGMKYTDTYNLAERPANIAVGYIPQADGTYKDNINSSGSRGSSAGGGYSTVTDLYQFALALFNNKLVSTQSKKLLFTDYMNKGYGYGFQLKTTALGKVIGHSGGAPGINAVSFSTLDQGYHIVVLSNYDRAAQRVGDYILQMIQ
jgi:CubicO group peptidase (beta-lactamase class C family)